ERRTLLLHDALPIWNAGTRGRERDTDLAGGNEHGSRPDVPARSEVLRSSRPARGAGRRVLGSADPRNRAGAGARIPVHLFRHPGLPRLSAPRPRPPAPEQGADPYIRDGGLIPGGEIEGWTRRDRQGTHRPARGAEARRARAGVHRATDPAYARGRGRTSPSVGIPLRPGDVPPGRYSDHVRS